MASLRTILKSKKKKSKLKTSKKANPARKINQKESVKVDKDYLSKRGRNVQKLENRERKHLMLGKS